MARMLFVTGTDTGVGKTTVAAALLHALVRQDLKVAAMKPVASGCRQTADGLVNEDALQLISQMNVAASYREVNPYAFAPPIAPHIAAAQLGRRIDLEQLKTAAIALAGRADVLVMEGAGGWLTPLNERETLADLAVALAAQVVLVVGLRLGCINHSLLTAEAIAVRGLKLAGWVANAVDPAFEAADANLETLQARLAAPLLGIIPHRPLATAAERAARLAAGGDLKASLSL